VELLAAIFLFACLSAFVQASVGFGYSLLFAPLAAILIAPADAVGASIVSGTVISVLLYAEHTPREPMRPMLPMAVMSVVTVPLGLWLLVIADESALRLMIGGAVLVSVAISLVQRRGGPGVHDGQPRRPDRVSWQLVAGALSGVMRGAVSLSGPPVILYQHWIGGRAGEIRSRMFAFFFWTGIPAVAIAAVSGVFGPDVWKYSLVASLALPGGVLAGRLFRGHMSDLMFARLSLTLLGATSAVATIGAVRNML
jgi:uncharacterized membrane protein YfcA